MCEFLKVLNGCHLQAEKLEKVARTLNLYEVAYFSVLFFISLFLYICELVFLHAALFCDLSVHELYRLKNQLLYKTGAGMNKSQSG